MLVAGLFSIAWLVVADAGAATILTNFGNTGFGQGDLDAAGNTWNNIGDIKVGGGEITDISPPYDPLSELADLLDTAGNLTGIGLAVTDPLNNSSGRDALTLPAFNDPDDGLLYEHSATGDYHFGRASDSNTYGAYTIKNLAPGVRYDLKILSARGNGDAGYVEEFTISHGGVTQMQSVPTGTNGVGGAYVLAKFVGLTPDGNNEILIEMDGSGNFTYVNFLRIDYDSSQVPEPVAASLMAALLAGCVAVRRSRPYET